MLATQPIRQGLHAVEPSPPAATGFDSAALERAIKDLQDLLAGARREVAHRDEYIAGLRAHLEEEVAWRDRAIAGFQQEIEDRDAGLRDLEESARREAREALERAQEAERSTRQTLEEQTEHLEALAAQVELMSGREDELRGMLIDAHRLLLERDHESALLPQREAELQATRQQLEEAEAFIAHTRSSRLWRAAGLYWAFGGWLRRLIGS